jgi:hypothetical protein
VATPVATRHDATAARPDRDPRQRAPEQLDHARHLRRFTIAAGRVGFASFDETGEFRNIVVTGSTK